MAKAFHPPLRSLERAVVDMCRMGAAGDASGVQLAARRLLRNLPPEVSDPATFRLELGSALAAAPTTAGPLLRKVSLDDIPTDGDSALPLVTLDMSSSEDPPIYEAAAERQLEAVIEERERGDELAAAGVAPTRTLLLTGPPGVGKTMGASYIAARLGLPIVTIDLATVMSSYLGRTGQNLRTALRFGRERLCVTFIDEFDALAKRRDDDSDIGELKRLVNVLLLELERWPSSTLLIAATNHEELLDRAISRRFDRVIPIDLPGPAERKRILAALLPTPEHDRLLTVLAGLTDGMSGSDLHRLGQAAARRSVLEDLPKSDALVFEISARLGRTRTSRDDACVLLHRELRWSQRRIADVLGVTHPTVGRALRKGDSSG